MKAVRCLKGFVVHSLLLTLSIAALSGAPANYAEQIQRLQPMSTDGLALGLANVLRNHYTNTFTSEQNWEKIESVRFDGMLRLPQGTVRFVAFKKKPDYCKVVLFTGKGGRYVMAFDGEDAWQLNTTQGSGDRPDHHSDAAREDPPSDTSRTDTAPQEEPSAIRPSSSVLPSAMAEGEARNFIRDATTGGHLLYPSIEGKTIELLGTQMIDGDRAYHLRTQLPDGQVIEHFLDMTTYAELRQITVNNVSGLQEVITHSDFRMIDGVRFAFASRLTVGGEPVHQIEIARVQTNVGVMPWMFSRPSGAYIPGAQAFELPTAADELAEPPADPASDWAPSPFFDFSRPPLGGLNDSAEPALQL